MKATFLRSARTALACAAPLVIAGPSVAANVNLRLEGFKRGPAD
jgi:hypothetical protein